MRPLRVLLVVLAASLSGCSVLSGGSATETLHGTVTYRARIALPPDAVLMVRVEDTSRADAAAREVARVALPVAGRQVPLPFRLTYRRSDAAPPAVLGVRAEIRDADGTLRWTTTQAYRLTDGRPPAEPLVLLLEQVPASGGAPAPPDLPGTSWRLVRLDVDGQMSRQPAEGEAYTLAFEADGRVGGQAHCNRFGGPYTLDGDRLTMGPFAMTLADCGPRSMDGLVMGVLREPIVVQMDGGESLRMVASSGSSLVFARAAPPAAPVPSASSVFVCPADEGAVRFTLRPGPGEAGVWLPESLGGRFAVLSQVPAASGVRYEADGLAVWTRGDEALLVVDDRRFEACRRDAAASVWEDARRRGVTFRAVGQEPGWTLEIGRGGRLRFAPMEGDAVEHPRPEVALDGRSTVYRVPSPDGSAFVVTVAPGRCLDAMSGEAFEAAVTVEVGGQVLRGCGRAL